MEKAKRDSWRDFVKFDLGPNRWGVVYKFAAEKIHKTGVLGAVAQENGQTFTKEEAMKNLVGALLPDDSERDEDEVQSVWRRDFDTDRFCYENDITEVTEGELHRLIQSIKPKKAPGLDEIRGRLLKVIFPAIKDFLIHLYNSCLRTGYFPKVWKIGNLKVLVKDPAGDSSNPKNYRPITLLPELGKILEKIIRRRLFEAGEQFHSPKQFGFIQGKSTMDALTLYTDLVRDQRYKFCATIFVDISGAFDVWWPALLRALRERRLPDHLTAIIKRRFLVCRKN